MSTEQLQEIIVDNSIRSFNQGYNAGTQEQRSRTSAALRELLSSDYVGVFDQDGNTIAMTKEDVIRRIEEVL
jgi:hypothetical protein